jgi:hypothetical protein
MISFTVIWIVLAIATVALALYRKLIAMHEEDYIHLGAGEERHIPKQVAMARRLNVIDHWGKTLTVITMVFGLMLAAFFLYQQWQVFAR